MKNNTLRDNYLEHHLEKALMNDRDRKFLLRLEEDFNVFISNHSRFYLILDQDSLEIEFNNKQDKNLAFSLLKRYISELKNTEEVDNPDKFSRAKDLVINISKSCNIKPPILKLSDFVDREFRDVEQTEDPEYNIKYPSMKERDRIIGSEKQIKTDMEENKSEQVEIPLKNNNEYSIIKNDTPMVNSSILVKNDININKV